jgi:hypothetical protein
MRSVLLVVLSLTLLHCSVAQNEASTSLPKETIVVKKLPSKQNVWAFLLAGQSNMAGRGMVEPSDTLPDPRILTINQKNEIVVAKEPLHDYEPGRTGLDAD